MRQATLIKAGTIDFSDVVKPEAGADEVLMEVKTIGICGSDIHAFHGKHPFMSFPITLGHEAAGLVVSVGDNVSGIVVGDRITFMPQKFCGQCEPCRAGRYNICNTLSVIGCQLPGAAADYLAVPASLVKKLPEPMDYDIGATIEPAVVGVHAAQRSGMDLKGRNALVIGAGTIGNLTAQACTALGTASVLIADISQYRLDIAKKCGVPHVINTGEGDLGEAMRAAFGKAGCDIIYECIGIEPTTNQAISIAKKGSDIVIVGVYGKRPQIDMALVQDKELRLIGSLMYVEKDYDTTMRFMADGRIDTHPLISASFPFAEYQQAFEYIDDNPDKSLKVLVKIAD